MAEIKDGQKQGDEADSKQRDNASLQIESPLADYKTASSALKNGAIESTSVHLNALNLDSIADDYKRKVLPTRSDSEIIAGMTDYGIPQQTFERVLKEIADFKESPVDVSRSLMKNNRVVGFGESHGTPNLHREFGKEILPQLARDGATHFAIEASTQLQEDLNTYMETGQIDVNKLPLRLRHDDYLSMLEEVRKSGLKIVAVDTKSGDRNEHMARTIANILDENADNRVVFWVGSQHLNRSAEAEKKTAADHLRERFSVAVIRPVEQNERGSDTYPLADLTSNIKEATAVSTKRAEALGSLPQSKYSDIDPEHMNDWDFVFIYPTRK